MDDSLRSWQRKQGYIVTGGEQVTLYSESGVDFEESDLPHYLLQHQQSHDTFRTWLNEDRRSLSIVGCWSRDIFAGGWMESTFHDTSAFNLQTPSLFIDMRFPTNRPTARLRKAGGLHACSAEDLRILARQHCFAGYSLPEIPRSKSGQVYLDPTTYPTFTRHHVIDWNLHLSFPRSRPNRWWVEINDEGETFKEHSSVRNPKTGLPVYFERWLRIPPFINQRTKYFAARKQGDRDAIFIIVGDHFALAVDRPPLDLTLIDSNHLKKYCSGGGAMFVDYLLTQSTIDKSQALEAARDYLDLEGSYGRVKPAWIIEQSTHPWLESTHLLSSTDSVSFISDYKNSEIVRAMHWFSSTRSNCHGAWEVLECSFTVDELSSLFLSTMESDSAACPYQFRSKL